MDDGVLRRRLLATNRRRFLQICSLTAAAASIPHAHALAPDSSINDSDIIGKMQFRLAQDGQTLLDLARQQDLGILEISAANPGVDAWIPGGDRLLVLPTAHLIPNNVNRRGIIVNLSELRLYYFPDDGETSPKTSSIGIGRDGFSTPLGESQIVRKKANPIWYPTDETRRDKPELPKIVGPGPDNPLGAHALYLGWPTYLIHGTNKPLGVGRRISRGCIRMYPEQVESLFSTVPVGTPVTVIQQPLKIGRHLGEIYLEAHPDFEQLDQLENTYRFDLKKPTDVTRQIIEFAGKDSQHIDWKALRSILVARRGYPEQITAKQIGTAAPRLKLGANKPSSGPRLLFPRG